MNPKSLHAFLLATAHAVLQMEVSGGADVALASEDGQALMEIEGAAPKKGIRKLAPLLLAATAPHAAEAFQVPGPVPRAQPGAVMPLPLAADVPAWRSAVTPTMMAGRGPGRRGRKKPFTNALSNLGESLDRGLESAGDAWEGLRRGVSGQSPDGGPLERRDAPRMPWDEGGRWPWQDEDVYEGPTSPMGRGPLDRRGPPAPGQWSARGSVRTWSQGPDGKRKSSRYDWQADPERFDDRYDEWPRPGEDEPPFLEGPFGGLLDAFFDGPPQRYLRDRDDDRDDRGRGDRRGPPRS